MSDNNYRMPKQVRRFSMRNIFLASITGVAGSILISQQVMVLLALRAGAGEIFIGFLSFAVLAPFILSLLTLPQIESRGKKTIILRWATTAVALIIPIIFLPQLAQALPLYAFMPVMFSILAMRMSAEALGFAAWFPILQDIVPPKVTGRFFGNLRTAWQSAALVSMLLAALFLGKNPHWWKFNVLFCVGFLLYVMKLMFLRNLSENPPTKQRHEEIPIRQIVAEFMRNKEQRRVLAYLVSYAVAFGMSIPFQIKFLKDMGRHDGFILAAAAMVNAGAVFSLRSWGRLADRFGSRSVFTMSHAGMVVVTIMWLFVQPGPISSVLVFVLFFMNSAFNSGNGIAQTRHILHSIPQDRQRDITIINMSIISAWGIAPLMAGLMLKLTENLDFSVLGRDFGNYHLLFVVNAFMFMIPRFLRRKLRYQHETPTGEVLTAILRPRNFMGGPFQRLSRKK